MMSCSGCALSQAAAASSVFRALASAWTWPVAKWTSGSSSRAENPAVGPDSGVGPAASGMGASGAGAASGHTGGVGDVAGRLAVTAVGCGASTCRAQPTISGASTPSARVTRPIVVIEARLESGQLVALGQPVVQHPEAELELGGQGLELLQTIAIGAQAAVFQQAAVSEHRETHETRLREQPLHVLGQHVLGLGHGVAPFLGARPFRPAGDWLHCA